MLDSWYDVERCILMHCRWSGRGCYLVPCDAARAGASASASATDTDGLGTEGVRNKCLEARYLDQSW